MSTADADTPIVDRLRPGSAYRQMEITITWIIAGLIPENAVILLFGRGGIGKTTLLMQLLGAVARGGEVIGLTTCQRPVVYIDFENSQAVLATRCKHIEADEILFLDGSNHPPAVDRPERQQYVELLDAYPGAVFVFDTLRSAQSGDENDSRSMGEVMRFFRELRDAGATVIVLHHTPKGNSRQYKGSGAIFDLCDHVLALYPVKKPGDEGEIDDDDDADHVYRLGTSQKTRYEPTRHFLKFDAETRRFVLAGDPADGHIETILQAMTDISARGDLVTQIKILNHLSGEIPKNKIVSLLRQHSGTHWTVGTGERNANIYVPNSVHQLSAPLRGWRTGELAESTLFDLASDPSTETPESRINTELASSPDTPRRTGEVNYLSSPEPAQKTEPSGELKIPIFSIDDFDLEELNAG